MELIIILVLGTQEPEILPKFFFKKKKSKIGAYASLSYCQGKRETLQKGVHSNKVLWTFSRVFSTQIYKEDAEIICTSSISSDLMVMRRNISPLPFDTGSQSHYSVPMKKEAVASRLDSNCSKAIAGLACRIEQSLPWQVFDGGEYFTEQKKEPGLSNALLQQRGLHCQRDCSMPFSPTFQEQDGYWVCKIQSLFLPE